MIREVELHQRQEVWIPKRLAVSLVTPVTPALELAVLCEPFQYQFKHHPELYKRIFGV